MIVKKLIALLLMILLSGGLFLEVKANSVITLAARDMPVEKVLSKIQKQTGYILLYDSLHAIMQQKISIMLNQVSLQQALNACLSGLPVTYDIFEREKIVVFNIVDKKLHTAASWLSANHGLIINSFCYGLILWLIIRYAIGAIIHKTVFDTGILLLALGLDYKYSQYTEGIKEQRYLSSGLKKRLIAALDYLQKEVDAVQYIKKKRIFNWFCKFTKFWEHAFLACHLMHFLESNGSLEH